MSDSSTPPPAVFGILFAVFIGIWVFACIIGCICRDLEKSERQVQTSNRPAGFREAEVLKMITIELLEKPARFSSEQIIATTHNFSTKLGSGGFGDVYKGDFHDGVKLAVKVLKNIGLDNKLQEEQFMAEVGTIGRTYHVNLVRLFGFCYDDDIKALVYEYIENGSLDNVLFDKTVDIRWDKLYEIAIGAAKGLHYLHHLGRQRIIHYDIKPSNILIDSQFCAKIADFGLAKLCNKDSTHVSLTGGCRGTPGYAAPELWMALPITYKCDVYSFGMTLFEILGRRRNFSSESVKWFPIQVWEEHEKGELEEFISLNGIEEKDKAKAKTMAMVALWCVQYSPDARPSMSQVLTILENENEVKDPPNPFLYLLTKNTQLPTYHSSISSSNSVATTSTPIMRKYEIRCASLP